MRDLDLAERLRISEPRNIRVNIEENRAELEGFGGVLMQRVKISAKGGRPGTEFWLNESQALLLCMFSRTAKAAEVRREVIQVFTAYRLGLACLGLLWRRDPKCIIALA